MTGKIVLANYFDILTHIDKQGYFLVIYDEEYDKSTTQKYNVIALKITSNTKYQTKYSLPIDHREFTKQSLLQCNRPYTFSKHDIVKVIGGVNDNYMKRVINTMSLVFREVNNQRERRAKYFEICGYTD